MIILFMIIFQMQAVSGITFTGIITYLSSHIFAVISILFSAILTIPSISNNISSIRSIYDFFITIKDKIIDWLYEIKDYIYNKFNIGNIKEERAKKEKRAKLISIFAFSALSLIVALFLIKYIENT